MGVVSSGRLYEWTANDEGIASILHKQNSTPDRSPLGRPTRSNAETLRNLDFGPRVYCHDKAVQLA